MKNDKVVRKTKKWAVSAIRAVFLVAFSFTLVYPVFYMLSNAIKTQTDIMNPSVQWLSRAPSFYSFGIAFKAMNYLVSLRNTVSFQLVSAVISVFSCMVYAYGLARFKFRFKNVLIFFLILIIFIPDVILIIPRIINFRHMDVFGILGLFESLTGHTLRPNLTDTVYAFYLPSLFGVGLKGGIFIFIYMQFFKGLPFELEEAAWIDGAGPIKTFVRVIVPNASVVILTVFIFAFIWHWNDWLFPMMYTVHNETLAVIIKDIQQHIFITFGYSLDTEKSFGIPLAACLMYIAPPTVLYLFLQKKFIQSIDRVGIVG